MNKGNGFIMEDADSDKKEHPLPKVDFSGFVLSLYSSGLVQIGKVEDPSTGEKKKDLELAKHTIDMIDMLSQKTKGNLTQDEENLLKTLLNELRIAFVGAKV